MQALVPWPDVQLICGGVGEMKRVREKIGVEGLVLPCFPENMTELDNQL